MAATCSTASSSLPWVEKYRPRDFSELVSVDHIVASVKNFIENGSFPHLLFYGPPGCGKTSTALAIVREIYKGSLNQGMVLELNASDDRGIGIVRNEIITFASTKSFFGKGYKFIILDEADAMTNESQNALRRVIEKYSKNAKFCLICNYLSGIIPAIQSRCTRFRFSPLAEDHIRTRLEHIVDKERVGCTKDSLQTIITLSSGDMRKCLNILESTFLSFKDVTSESVYKSTGHPSNSIISEIFSGLCSLNLLENYKRIMCLKLENGIALADIITEIHIMVVRSDLSSKKKGFVTQKLADLERALAFSVNEKIHLGALIGIFIASRKV